jgi:hypothetical protein
MVLASLFQTLRALGRSRSHLIPEAPVLRGRIAAPLQGTEGDALARSRPSPETAPAASHMLPSEFRLREGSA